MFPARWWRALNPAIYLVSILPGVGVWQLLRPVDGALLSLVTATLAVVLLQHAINLWNDAADWRLGADAEKWSSWVHVHGGRLNTVKRHGWLAFLAGGLLGLLVLGANSRWWILVFALPLVALGIRYNSGERPLSYTRLGEWVTGACYGGVFGGLWLVTRPQTDVSTLWGCLAFACFATALLLSHQPPQISTDRQAGKQSFAVRYGVKRTYQAVRSLFLLFLITWGFTLSHVGGAVFAEVFYLVASVLVFAGACSPWIGPKYLLLSTSGLFAVLVLIR